MKKKRKQKTTLLFIFFFGVIEKSYYIHLIVIFSKYYVPFLELSPFLFLVKSSNFRWYYLNISIVELIFYLLRKLLMKFETTPITSIIIEVWYISLSVHVWAYCDLYYMSIYLNLNIYTYNIISRMAIKYFVICIIIPVISDVLQWPVASAIVAVVAKVHRFCRFNAGFRVW